MIIDRLHEQLSLHVVVWNSVIYIDHSRPSKARPPTNHTTPEGPVQPCGHVQPCGRVHFSVAALEQTCNNQTFHACTTTTGTTRLLNTENMAISDTFYALRPALCSCIQNTDMITSCHLMTVALAMR